MLPTNKVLVRRSFSSNLLLAVVLILLSLATVFEVVHSLRWRMEHDTPLLHYAAWLMVERGAIPYRDIFETSMPGTFLFHMAIGKLFGWGDRPFQLVDVASIAVLGLATWKLLRSFGQSIAIAAWLLFVLSYLRLGPSMTLQRDYLGLILIVIAAALATRSAATHHYRIYATIGLLIGFGMLIKPHLAIGLLPISAYIIWSHHRNVSSSSTQPTWLASAIPVLATIAATALLPIVITIAILRRIGAWPIFWELVTQYLPLHIQLSGVHRHIRGLERFRYDFLHILILGHLWFWLPMATLGVYLAWQRTRHAAEQRALLWMLLGLAVAFIIYPTLSGQFWAYHWMPFQFFLVVLASFSLLPLADPKFASWRWLSLILFAFAVFTVILPKTENRRDFFGATVSAPKHGDVDRIATLLKQRMRAGDTIQPLDWTEGSIHAMLLAHAQIATPFLYDYHFYHDVNNPEIIRLRQRFIDALNVSNPRFILYMNEDWPRVTGPGTSTQFPQLSDYIAQHYVVTVQYQDFVLLERTCNGSLSSGHPAFYCDTSATACIRADCFGNMHSLPPR